MAVPAPTSQSFGYKPALDGLRAVAVGSVIAFHFGANWAPGGFLGVDTFFVLSGYLITSLLLAEWGEHGTLRFTAFWARRARRLLPALCLVLAAIGAWATWIAQTDTLGAIRADSLWTLFYGANWHFLHSGQSYFDLFRNPSPLRHAWSLAIEEQFYLVWPLITFACLRLGRGRPRVLGWVCGVGIAASALWLAHLYQPGDPSRAYYGTDTRASQLLVGALLAIVLSRWSPRSVAGRGRLQVLGIVAAAGCVLAFALAHDNDAWLYHGGFLAFALATAAVIAAIVQPGRGPLHAVLALRPVRWIGAISYGLYLWHWPVVVIINEQRTHLPGLELALVRLVVTVGAATLSYYLVELPIRRGQAFLQWRARLAAPAAIVLTGVVLLAATASATAPPVYLVAPRAHVLEADPPTPPTTAPAPVALAPIPTRWVLLGDSVATSLTPAFQAEAANQGITAFSLTRPGCGMISAEALNSDGSAMPWSARCAAETADYQSRAMRDTGAQVVVWLSGWEAADHLFGGQQLVFGTLTGDAAVMGELEASVDRLSASGARVVILTQPPRTPDNDIGLPATSEVVDRLEHLNVLYQRLEVERPDSVLLVDFDAIVCPGGPPCPGYVDGVRLRPYDGSHFDAGGAAWVAPRVIAAIVAALRAAP